MYIFFSVIFFYFFRRASFIILLFFFTVVSYVFALVFVFVFFLLSAQVDCMENHLLCGAEPYSIKGYPTLFLAKKGKTFKYEGKPETRDIVEFMLKVARPSLKAR